MAKQIWYPEEGDEIKMGDGRSGAITSESPVSQDEGDWTVQAELVYDKEGEDLEESETEDDISVQYDEAQRTWMEK